MWRINDRFEHFQAASSSGCNSILSYPVEIIIIVVCCLVGIIWGIVHIIAVEKIDVENDHGYESLNAKSTVTPAQRHALLDLGKKISDGAKSFLKQ